MELLEWIEINKTKEKGKLKDSRYFDLWLVGGTCFLTLLFGIIYVLMSKTVYFWDNSTYWDISRMLSEKPINFDFFKEVYNSIGTNDYNYFIAVPVALWMKLFGTTRISYVIAVILFYVLPTQIVIYLIARRMKRTRLAFAVSILCIPAFVYNAVIGFIDVAGVLIGLLCYYLYFTDVLRNKPYIKSVLLGVLLVIIMLTRRYFAFFAVSFVTVMALNTILFKKSFKELAVTVSAIAIMLVVFFNPFLVNILLKNYGTLYSSYKYSVFTDFKLITRYFGVVFILLVFVQGIYLAIKKKEMRCLSAIMQIVICASMFMLTQTHGQQHLLMYIPPLTMLVMLAVDCIDKKALLITLSAVALLNFVSPSIKRVQPKNIQEIKTLSLFPSYSVKPETRSDINAILALKRNLDKKIPEGENCGVLASSFTLNSSILINVVPSLNKKEMRQDNYIIGLPEVDSRDYWRLNELYQCGYLLVATPAQTHLSPKEQTIIVQAVKSFDEGTDIANSFMEIKDFKTKIGDVDVRLYKRVKDVSETEKTEFELKLYK